MAKFSIGEVAILLYSDNWPDHPECECTIQGYGRFRSWREPFELRYDVIDEAGEEWDCTEDLLKKKPPPSLDRESGSWDECPWRPALPVSEFGNEANSSK